MTPVKIIFIPPETLKLLTEPRCTRTVVFVCLQKQFSLTEMPCFRYYQPRCTRTVVFLYRFSSVGRAPVSKTGCRRSESCKRCHRRGQCVPCPRPDADGELCYQTEVYPQKGVFHHEQGEHGRNHRSNRRTFLKNKSQRSEKIQPPAIVLCHYSFTGSVQEPSLLPSHLDPLIGGQGRLQPFAGLCLSFKHTVVAAPDQEIPLFQTGEEQPFCLLIIFQCLLIVHLGADA